MQVTWLEKRRGITHGVSSGKWCRLVLCFYFQMIGSIAAATYFVAPDGSNSNSGTIDKPFASMKKGHDVAKAGDTVFMRGGTYKFSGKGLNANCGIHLT